MNKKHLIIAGIIFAIAIVAGGAWLYSQKSEPLAPTNPSISMTGKCGDGICGPVEKEKGVCPQNCD